MKTAALLLLLAAEPKKEIGVWSDQPAPAYPTPIIWYWQERDRADGLWLPKEDALKRATELRDCRQAAKVTAPPVVPWWAWIGLGAALKGATTVGAMEFIR